MKRNASFWMHEIVTVFISRQPKLSLCTVFLNRSFKIANIITATGSNSVFGNSTLFMHFSELLNIKMHWMLKYILAFGMMWMHKHQMLCNMMQKWTKWIVSELYEKCLKSFWCGIWGEHVGVCVRAWSKHTTKLLHEQLKLAETMQIKSFNPFQFSWKKCD